MSSGVLVRRRARAWTLVPLVALLALACLLLTATPASAHDELVSTSPADGDVVETLPAELTFTFSGNLMSGDTASEVQVTDATRASLTDGDVVVSENTMVQALTGSSEGEVTVLWLAVYGDGHPGSGSFTFTVTPAAAPGPTATPTTTPSDEASADPEPVETETAPAAAEEDLAQEDTGGTAPIVPILVGVTVLAVAAIAYLLISRERRQRAIRESTRGASEHSSGR